MRLRLLVSQLHVPSAQVNLNENELGDEGWCAIFDALRDSPKNKIANWDLQDEGVGPTTAKSLAAYVAASGSLASLDLTGNQLCGVWIEWEMDWDDLEYEVQKGTYDASGIKALADALGARSSH